MSSPIISREEVLSNGRTYVERVIRPEAAVVKEAREDWLKALEFFYSRVLLQGRSDEVSHRVISVVKESLEETFRELGQVDTPKDLLDPLRFRLEERIGRGRVGKRGDIDLVTDTLVFLEKYIEGDWNIVNYAVRMIRSELIDCLCYRLMEEIRGVGPKTSMLFLRGLYLHFEEELRGSMRRLRYFEYLQPVDTWVRRVAQMLGMIEYPRGEVKEGNKWDREIRRAIVKEFKERSPLFNAGAWYTGYVVLGGNELKPTDP